MAASFGRGFFVFDDYSPLRQVTEESLAEEAMLFPVKDPWMFVLANPMGGGEKAVQGDGLYTAPNPPYGAVFTYYLAESLETSKQRRKREEREALESGQRPSYPTGDQLRAEDREQGPEKGGTL